MEKEEFFRRQADSAKQREKENKRWKKKIWEEGRERVRGFYRSLGSFPPNEQLTQQIATFFSQSEEEYNRSSVQRINKAIEEVNSLTKVTVITHGILFSIDTRKVMEDLLDLFQSDSFGEGSNAIAARVFQAIGKSVEKKEIKEEVLKEIKRLNEGELNGREAAERTASLFDQGFYEKDRSIRDY